MQYKADGMDKTALAPHIQELLALKAKIAPPDNRKKEKKPQNKKKKVEEMSESKLHQACLGKVQAMREANVEPYAYTYDRTHSSGQLNELYEEKLEGGEEDESADVAVAGRIIAKRVFGRLAFFTLQDETSTIQLHLEKNRLDDSFKVRTVHMHSQKLIVYGFVILEPIFMIKKLR